MHACDPALWSMLTRLALSFGLNEAAAKIWSLLLLVDKPLSQKEIASLSSYSVGVVSSNLSLLESRGLVARVGRAGRARLYAAKATVSDLVAMFLSDIVNCQLSAIAEYLRALNGENSCLSVKELKGEVLLLLRRLNSLVRRLKRLKNPWYGGPAR